MWGGQRIVRVQGAIPGASDSYSGFQSSSLSSWNGGVRRARALALLNPREANRKFQVTTFLCVNCVPRRLYAFASGSSLALACASDKS
jgi:hypothetical protein